MNTIVLIDTSASVVALLHDGDVSTESPPLSTVKERSDGRSATHGQVHTTHITKESHLGTRPWLLLLRDRRSAMGWTYVAMAETPMFRATDSISLKTSHTTHYLETYTGP